MRRIFGFFSGIFLANSFCRYKIEEEIGRKYSFEATRHNFQIYGKPLRKII